MDPLPRSLDLDREGEGVAWAPVPSISPVSAGDSGSRSTFLIICGASMQMILSLQGS